MGSPYLGQIVMSMQDADGNYYSASQATNATWAVTTGSAVSYITVPDGWQDTEITWQRDMNYLGVFRSMNTRNSYRFAFEGRAIIKYVRSIQGIQGYIRLTVYVWNEWTFDYDEFYASNIDFTTYKDNLQNELLDIGTLDSDLIRDMKAYADTPFNIPVWNKIAPHAWGLNADVWIKHEGIKVLYNSTWVTSATDANNLFFGINSILGFNGGKHGAAPNDGDHTFLNLAPYNPVQNNGATTFIGNTLLEKLLLQQGQTQGAAGAVEESFGGTNQSQPYTRSNFSLFNALPNDTDTIDAWVNVTAYIQGDISYDSGTNDAVAPYLSFAMFEIDETDTPPQIAGKFQCVHIFKYALNGGDLDTPGGPVNATVPVTLKNNRAYVFCLLLDQDAPDNFNPTGRIVTLIFSQLQFSIYSRYDYGASGVPIIGPSSPPSPVAGFKLISLFEKLLPNLATTSTDIYGFPIPVATPYTAQSNYIGDAAQPTAYDCRPYSLLLTSGYCIHNLQGQAYISISLKQLFEFCKWVLGAGASLEYDINGEPTIFKVEQFSYFFDNTTAILDLGSDVENVEIEPLIEMLGSNLKLGYTKADTNSNFGVDSFNTELFFNTPLSMMPGTIDMEETAVITDQYPIELARIQQLNQPVGTSFDPANPSSDNAVIALYTTSNPIGTVDVYDPENTPITGQLAYGVLQRSNAQNFDTGAAAAPYIRGLYYPDTAYNMEISPKRNMMRCGGLLHSFFDAMDASNLTFRRTGIMQYNNVAQELSGIASNLDIGSGADGYINEFADVKIADLPPQLFKPYLISFKSKYPVNMYQLIKTNPRGYIKFNVTDVAGNMKTYKGFIYTVKQIPGTREATEFKLLATPDMVF